MKTYITAWMLVLANNLTTNKISCVYCQHLVSFNVEQANSLSVWLCLAVSHSATQEVKLYLGSPSFCLPPSSLSACLSPAKQTARQLPGMCERLSAAVGAPDPSRAVKNLRPGNGGFLSQLLCRFQQSGCCFNKLPCGFLFPL